MSIFELKLIIYLCLAASGLLAIVILLLPQDTIGGAVLCLWGCGVLIGMSWQLLIDKKTCR